MAISAIMASSMLLLLSLLLFIPFQIIRFNGTNTTNNGTTNINVNINSTIISTITTNIKDSTYFGLAPIMLIISQILLALLVVVVLILPIANSSIIGSTIILLEPFFLHSYCFYQSYCQQVYFGVFSASKMLILVILAPILTLMPIMLLILVLL